MFRYLTAGESHGPALVGIVDGLPAGMHVDFESLADQMRRRQGGHGRGQRMKIEADEAEFLAGLRGGMTLGSPLALIIRNKDYENVRALMDPRTGAGPPITRPRPGHADYAGAVKYRHRDLRNVLERASARETAMRVAIGEIARQYLGLIGISVAGYVLQIGDVVANAPERTPATMELDASPVRCQDPDASAAMVTRIDEAKASGDTLGGVFAVSASGLPVGLGGNRQPSDRLDARIAAAVMSVQTVKAVEIGTGIVTGGYVGSKSHDTFEPGEIGPERGSNRAGGIEGGMSNGQDVVVRVRVKPIATLMKPLASVDLTTGETAKATIVRSDVCAVPAASVIGEAMVCIALAEAVSEKYGADSVEELRANFEASQKGARALFAVPKHDKPAT
ncbi:MAG TPA: chorismate synthase [Candidatus Eremiobacteraceae bacterium]|jgi:chorismate synthase